jgi:adenylate kinase
VEDELPEGGYLIDWHACDFFPVSWIDMLVVLRAATETLFDRLTARGYNETKREQNIDVEICEVLLNEAREGFPDKKIMELQSNTIDDLDANVKEVVTWIEGDWKKKVQKQEEEAQEGASET